MNLKTGWVCLLFLWLSPLHAEDLPLFIADLHNPNDFSLFANGGWDGNWYVGSNACWIQKIKVPPKNGAVRAYIGAKLGRMKNPGQPAEIYMAVSSTPAWTRAQSFLLVSGADIPREPDPQNAVEGAGEARWFWREIPLESIRFNEENYLALWSPTPGLSSAGNAPILAGGWGTKTVNTWLNSEIKGAPPSKPKPAALTPVSVFEPAIALKLISGQNDKKQPPQVRIVKIEDGKTADPYPAPKVLWASMEGSSVDRAWVEISTDSKTWNRYGRLVWNAPYAFTLKVQDLPIGPQGETWVRVRAADLFENAGVSAAVNLFREK